jgi:hypothetical protein
MALKLRCVFLSFTATLIAANSSHAQSFRVADLGPSVYTAKAINNSGQIVGALSRTETGQRHLS